MDVIERVAELRERLDGARCEGATVGLVPTMGYLHDGHLSLMERAREECDLVAATIFVNPLQFGPGEDLAGYPRDLERDQQLAEKAGVDVLLCPPVEEMYPDGAGAVATSVSVSGLSEPLEGRSRPGHFDGVATVVAKLFAIAGACRAYFGEKDYQQLAVVRRMARDLSFPVEVVGCPTVRELDGLAMSSRNAYLDEAQREAATVLYDAVKAGAAAIAGGEREPAAVRELMAEIIEAEPLAELDYAEVVDAPTLERPHPPLAGELRLLVAARVGPARLIDNVGVTVT